MARSTVQKYTWKNSGLAQLNEDRMTRIQCYTKGENYDDINRKEKQERERNMEYDKTGYHKV